MTKSEPQNQDPHHDETDVPAALARKTDDGPGGDPDNLLLPASDWVSFATEGVEVESKEDE